jgi:hypothetical protein
MEILEETIQKTIKCEKNFYCLSCKPEELCKVIINLNPQLSIVQCGEDVPCLFFESYGKTKICKCPIRNELYNRYKV